ncbi:MAG: hypothetical protein ACRC8S_17875 [Fimbriiglobus sp.]
MEIFSKSSSRAELRFQGESGQIVAAPSVSFPIEMAVRKPTHEAALMAARQLLATLEKEAGGLGAGAVVVVVDSIRFEFEVKGLMLLQLIGRLTVTISPGDFWPRTESVAKLLDVIQKYCDPSKERADVGMQTGRAELAYVETKPVS